MSDNGSFSTSFLVQQTPQEVFAAISDVRGWWSGEIEGTSERVGDQFTYRYENLHFSRQEVTESLPGRRIVWHVVEAHLSFTQDPAEWVGTDIIFDIASVEDGAELRFTHDGLTPQVECYEACSSAWGGYVRDSLRKRVASTLRASEK